MSKSSLNIHFCGTSMKPTRQGTASLGAIRKFDETKFLVLSGVGAESVTKNNKSYLTPGTFYVDQQLNQKERLFSLGASFFSFAGLVWGAGEDDNITYAMRHIDNIMADKTGSVVMNLSGYSRGGTGAIRLANAIYQKYGTRIQLNLFLIDPNAGYGRQDSQRKKNIPRNVKNVYFTFSRAETNPILHFYRPPSISHYCCANKNTCVSTVYLAGNHHNQELIPRNDDPNEITSAKVNQYLLENFYNSSHLKKRDGAQLMSIDQEKINAIANKGLSNSNIETSASTHKVISKMEYEERNESINFLNHCQRELQCFDEAVFSSPHNENHTNLAYYFNQLLCELPHDVLSKNELKLVDVTTRLISAMNPKSNSTIEQKNTMLNEFKQCLAIGGFTDALRQVASVIVGLITGILLGLAFAIGGFFIGLMRYETAGTASIPFTFIAAYNGVLTGFNYGRRITLGHENARYVDKYIQESVENSCPLDSAVFNELGCCRPGI